jgi:hypothetical protein
VFHPDSIEGYLALPAIDMDEIKSMGGVMMYWYRKEGSCPSLSRYGSDYCSAPGMYFSLQDSKLSVSNSLAISASSTDAERSFSEGRREVNFMQHNMASQTFKAEMAVGSWDGTPLFPQVDAAILIMEKKLDRRVQS